ncbi:MAG: hypothetical protein DMG67_08720 [Acidobacteria bacterium]|nr:MAG: hypothetical protein DMG67_08720 [Acidobacteriota bacterium]
MGATYILQADVSSAASCFSVQADDVTLDLNHHTITYATELSPDPHYGVLAEACWDSAVAANPCGGSADHLTIGNGTITQGGGAAPRSHGIRIGQINRTNFLTVHGHNRFNNQVTTIADRHAIEGASIKLASAGPGQAIDGNVIEGGAQGGIYSTAPGTTISNNQIRQNGRYSNDFGIYLWATKQQAFGNNIAPVSGRGIQVGGNCFSKNCQASSGQSAHDNQISVTELRQNCDYSAGGKACNVCQPGGAYGIQFDDSATKATAYGNTVTAKAEDCDAQALRITSNGEGDSSHDNVYVARHINSTSAKAWALGLEVAPNLFTSTNDVFIGDSATVHVDWQGASGGFHCIRCTLGRGDHPDTGNVTFSFSNGGGDVANFHFLDTVFTGGAAKDSTDLHTQDANHRAAEYFIDWTYSLKVQNASGQPAQGASVEIVDAHHHGVFQEMTDQSGNISVALTELHAFNSAAAVNRETDTPHFVTVSSGNCRQSLSITLDRPTVQTMKLNCR